MSERNESDRLQDESWIQRMMRRPEIGSFIVMIIIILALGLASEGKAFNALGLKNNIAIIAQLGIIAVGAALLMIAGEFDLSIGPMIAFAGMSIAIMLNGAYHWLRRGNSIYRFFNNPVHDIGIRMAHWDYCCQVRVI